MEAGLTCAYMVDSLGADGQPAPYPTLRLVIGENNADLATTMTMLFDAEPGIECVAIAASGAAVVAALEAHSPNGFVLDLSLDDGSSLPLIAMLRERSPQAVIVVSHGVQER